MSDPNSQTLRDAVARRIRGLLAKTVENGATEAEALAAAARARAIMDQYRMTQSDIEVQAEPIERAEVDRPNERQMAAADLILTGLDKYCGVETWFNTKYDTAKRRQVRRLVIFGLSSDVEMATYLYEMVVAAIEAETRAFAANPAHRGDDAAETRRINQSFQVGMGRRIRDRLTEMAQTANAAAVTSSGTALVVVKDAVVKQAYDALGLKMGRALSGPRATDRDAYQAGRAAGDRVNLSRPLSGGGSSAIRIGGK